MFEHWKTLQEGWVNALDTLYDLFLILDNLLCKGETLNKYNTRFHSYDKENLPHGLNKEGFFN